MDGKSQHSFAAAFTRWFVWFCILSVAYFGAECILLGLAGSWPRGLVILITGAPTDAVIGALVALPIAYLSKFAQRNPLATTLKRGMLGALVTGLVLGSIGYYTTGMDKSGQPSANCTESMISTKFSALSDIASAIERSNKPLKVYRSRIDGLWNPSLDCDNGTVSLSDRAHGQYLDFMLIGNALSVEVYYDDHAYALARQHLTTYDQVADTSRPIAQQKGWKSWLSLEASYSKVMAGYGSSLKSKGY